MSSDFTSCCLSRKIKDHVDNDSNQIEHKEAPGGEEYAVVQKPWKQAEDKPTDQVYQVQFSCMICNIVVRMLMLCAFWYS